jgi:deoxyribodipyrimidine photo-lyase
MNQLRPRDLDRLPGLPRGELASAVATTFPDCVDPTLDAAALAALPEGGRRAALQTLAAFDPAAYARTRNHVSGAVSGLSPWIRHGALSLAEVRDHALGRVTHPEEAEKFVSELAWRDYWRRVHATLGDRISADIEPAAAAARRPDRLDAMPADVLAAATGMRCIDAFVRKLHDTGRLHNHERMWLASWLVHVRRVRWQAGADWFLRHLLDGDPASNHLSWQWVAGTFSAKPYIFNRENLQTFTADAHCTPCPLHGRCDVEGSYDELTARLFAAGPVVTRPPLRIRPAGPWRATERAAAAMRPLVWLTLDSASATSPAAVAHPDAPTLFVLDPAWLAAERPSLKRLVFLFECLRDVPGVLIEVGDPGTIVPTVARATGCDAVALAATPCPRVRRAADAIADVLPVAIREWPPLCADARVDDLGRFSRFWGRVRGTAMRPTGPAAA